MGLIAAITHYLFINEPPERADVILIPGSPYPEPMERAVQLYLRGLAPLLVPSGRSWIFDRRGEAVTECEQMSEIARAAGVPPSSILREDRARHTLDNARLSRQALDDAGVKVQTAMLCCQSFHGRRCFKAYGKHFADVRLIVCSAPTRGFNATNWYRSPVGVFKVFTELLKCSDLFFFLISFAKAK